jgi:hypothetical protein
LREQFERYVRIPMRDTVEEENITKGVREVCDILGTFAPVALFAPCRLPLQMMRASTLPQHMYTARLASRAPLPLSWLTSSMRTTGRCHAHMPSS